MESLRGLFGDSADERHRLKEMQANFQKNDQAYGEQHFSLQHLVDYLESLANMQPGEQTSDGRHDA